MSCLLSVGDKNSLVHGFISDGIFEGKIHTSNDEYHVESVKRYFSDAQDFHSVIFRRSDVHYPHAYGSNCGISGKTKRWMEDVQRCVENYMLWQLGLQRYIFPRYDTYPNTVVTIRYMIRYDNNKTRRVLPRVLLVGSEVCTADKPSLEYNAKYYSAWIFLVNLFGIFFCIRTKKRKEGEHYM